jgi:transcriptional regulator with XRE-family HTH domain
MPPIKLTTGERLTLYREQKRTTQKQLANLLDVSQATLSMWERDYSLFPLLKDIPVFTPSRGELCRVLRRRLKLTLRDIGQGMGLSHVTIVRMEQGKKRAEILWRYLVKLREEKKLKKIKKS